MKDLNFYSRFDSRANEIYLPVAEFMVKEMTDLRHGEWELMAEIPKMPEGGDGHPCRIYECRLPARFFKLEVLPTENSGGGQKHGFSLSTGSGDDMGVLIVRMAIAVAQGMLGVEQ